ncbi:MAG: SDR family NAD(P)-dependent oxidoreductase [bacterium]|jgi:NAD(P)-dependent dehydrogenase (short-subunit alcohol dehydrogenase family)|nr:SDR family NAD(P)-dependent oxidoreductase [bacterium]
MSEHDEFFAGKVAVVTGASTGIGLGLGRNLLDSGAEVYLSSRTPAHIAEAAESLRQHRERVHAQVLDVREEKAVAEYMDYVAGRGRVDYLFCNAGVGYSQPYHEATKRADWDTVFDVNVFGVVNCIHHLLPHLVKQGSGHIVIVSSVGGFSPLPYSTVYVASKHAVFGLARSLKYELENWNIEVSVVCPGGVATNIFYRALDYSLHFDRPIPPDAISIDQAGAEILKGIRDGEEVIAVGDDGRQLWGADQAGRHDEVEALMQTIRDTSEDGFRAEGMTVGSR